MAWEESCSLWSAGTADAVGDHGRDGAEFACADHLQVQQPTGYPAYRASSRSGRGREATRRTPQLAQPFEVTRTEVRHAATRWLHQLALRLDVAEAEHVRQLMHHDRTLRSREPEPRRVRIGDVDGDDAAHVDRRWSWLRIERPGDAGRLATAGIEVEAARARIDPADEDGSPSIAVAVGLKDVAILSAGTDGSDGPTDAAGAIATGETIARALGQSLEPAAFLANNDSYHFFDAVGGLIKTGPTNTNVMDIRLILLS